MTVPSTVIFFFYHFHPCFKSKDCFFKKIKMKNDIYCCGDYQKPWPPSSEQPVIWRHILKYTGVHTHKNSQKGERRGGRERRAWVLRLDWKCWLYGATLKSHFSVTLDVRRSFSNPKVIEQAEWWDPLEIQSPQSVLCAVYTAHICESLKNVAWLVSMEGLGH